MTADTESTTIQATGPAKRPKPTTKPNAAPRKPPCRAREGQVGQQDYPGEEGHQGREGGQTRQKESGARQGTKTEKVLDLLKRPKGATLKELLKATGPRQRKAAEGEPRRRIQASVVGIKL